MFGYMQKKRHVWHTYEISWDARRARERAREREAKSDEFVFQRKSESCTAKNEARTLKVPPAESKHESLFHTRAWLWMSFCMNDPNKMRWVQSIFFLPFTAAPCVYWIRKNNPARIDGYLLTHRGWTNRTNKHNFWHKHAAKHTPSNICAHVCLLHTLWLLRQRSSGIKRRKKTYLERLTLEEKKTHQNCVLPNYKRTKRKLNSFSLWAREYLLRVYLICWRAVLCIKFHWETSVTRIHIVPKIGGTMIEIHFAC